MRSQLGVYTGLSDHSRDPLCAPVAATGLGAVALEKHFTLSNRLPGPDHAFAVEPHELKVMVQAVRCVKFMLGNGEKKRHAVEEELANYRRAVFTIKPVRAGDPFTRANVAVLRKPGMPEAGLSPDSIERVLTRTAGKDLPAYVLVHEEDVR